MSEQFVSQEEMGRQAEFSARVKEWAKERSALLGRPLYAHIDTYGCQQNENDSEKLMGMLVQMGFTPSETRAGCDFLMLNTCAIREHAEQRVYGNLGALKKIWEKDRSIIVALCGCMAQQSHVSAVILEKYRHVGILFGPQALYRFPEMVWQYITERKPVVDVRDVPGQIAEGIPQYRSKSFSAYVTIMSGCNNFCAYCVVPYVRGRERSRLPEAVLAEVKELVSSGCREITLLGQNVNSYGKDLDAQVDFADLLKMADELEGDFRIKFMTSHPKDITRKLLDVMASGKKICHHLHLPVQAGSDRVLAEMNRHYDASQYLSSIDYARKVMPDITFTTDIIVGFPGETEEDFEKTLSLVEKVRYEMMFSFLYSRRRGTPAYDRPDQIPYNVKLDRFNRLLALQERISGEQNALLAGKEVSVLVMGRDEKNNTLLSGRTAANKLVFFEGGDALIGHFAKIRITQAKTWFLFGEIMKEEE